MLLQWVFFTSYSILILVEETISINEITLYRTTSRTPLALIKKHDSTTLQLAIPQENNQDWGIVNYHYNDSEDENGPKEEFLIACPEFYDGPESATKEYWRETRKPAKDGAVLFLTQYVEHHWQCFWELVPSIKKINTTGMNYCSQSQAGIYGVGYELTNSKGTDIHHVFVYNICYSKDERKTLYSIHRIETPSLLLLDHTEELPDRDPLNGQYESFLDSIFNTKSHFEGKKYYAYQYVGVDDMVIRPWKLTTNFLFNYTPITRNADIFKAMIRADFYIRLYSKKSNKPLTLYSGTHQKLITSNIPCSSWLCKPTPIDSFWRIIIDDEGHAIILVTQHTQKKCGNAYLCEKNRQEKTYKKGGCIYTCSLKTNDYLFRILDLPDLKITGDLDFTLDTAKTETNSSEEGKSSREKSTKNSTDIFSFLSNASFLDAIANIDPDIANNMLFRRAA